MNKLNLPDYNNCIINVACSIKKYFDLDFNHATNGYLDEVLSKEKPRNVVMIVFDGMGVQTLNNHLTSESFCIKNVKSEIFSVAPATTTAATTSILSGLSPMEHGWLGWHLYVEPENKIVTMFTNKIKNTDIEAASYNVSKKYFSYAGIVDLINDKNDCYANTILPFGQGAYKDVEEMFSRIYDNLDIKSKNYIYAYCDQPDEMLHKLGTDDVEISDWFQYIDHKIEEFTENLDNTLLIIMADHGHKNCERMVLNDYPDIIDKIDDDVSIEGRTCSFKIKPGKEKAFEEAFNRHFQNDFVLMTKESVIEDKLFGEGEEHPLFRVSLGDYIALGIGDKYLVYKEDEPTFKSVHAGYAAEELKVPLIIIKK